MVLEKFNKTFDMDVGLRRYYITKDRLVWIRNAPTYHKLLKSSNKINKDGTINIHDKIELWKRLHGIRD